ncbi:hypothetical protein G3N95_30005 [Paraburkholderia sp. Tr-20389]|uniref:hypothetical protein n=1 Tax=Paraburkholderia sp. Tr-20389 TaxID=2703903 RepID=UPI001981FF95|nr:hypothetical protein [Paraburkholderia sp. Tr-20389]MBN3757209.1 hypothetical protein [Paraburkholderia sp. Tr-20389]
MSGHGWVTPNADGSVAKCGGPAICRVCAREKAALEGLPPVRNEPPPMPAVKPAKRPWQPADIMINGRVLTSAESECLRAAVTSFLDDMQDDDALGKDEHGRLMTKAYRVAMERILSLMLP